MVVSVLGLIGKKTSQLAKRSYSIGKKNSFILIGKNTSQLAKRSYSIGKKTFSLFCLCLKG
jgi:hypothetical protein